MCNYANKSTGLCDISKENCPYLYYCSKISGYKQLGSMPELCKIQEQFELPKGCYKVAYENKHRLYDEVGDLIERINNPFDYAPSYVQMVKMKSGKWKIKQAVGVKQ